MEIRHKVTENLGHSLKLCLQHKPRGLPLCCSCNFHLAVQHQYLETSYYDLGAHPSSVAGLWVSDRNSLSLNHL